MLTKTHLLLLHHETRTFTLVGAFMGYFALLEKGIEAALGEVLGISGVRHAIVSRNMGFEDKIKTLRVLVDMFIANKEVAARFDDLAKRARKYGETRNVVAHTPFRQSPVSDGVEFFRVSATSKLEFPDMDWSIDDFLTHFETIDQLDNDLRSIESRISLQRVAEALMRMPDKPATLGGLFGLGASEAND